MSSKRNIEIMAKRYDIDLTGKYEEEDPVAYAAGAFAGAGGGV